MATWARGVSFKNSNNTKTLGGVGLYGTDTAAQKVYLGLGAEPWNNQGLELTSTTIKFKGKDISLSDHTHSGYASSSHGHDNYVQGSNSRRTTDRGSEGANTIDKSGFYRPGNVTAEYPDGKHSGLIHVQHPSGKFAFQIGSPYTTANKLYFRNRADVDTWNNWLEVYHTGFKPTPADIGAASSSHTHTNHLELKGQVTNIDTATGHAIYFHKPSSPVGWPSQSGSHNGIGILSINTHSGNYYTQLALSTADNKMFIRSANNTTFNSWQQVYTTQHKPTASDVGAAPAAGSTSIATLSSKVKFGDGAAFTVEQNNGTWWQKFGTQDTSDKGIHRFYFSERQGDGDYVELFGVDGNGEIYAKNRKVYHTGFKPSASDVGAININGSGLTGTIQKAGSSQSWLEGAKGSGCILNMTSQSGYSPMIRQKTSKGAWVWGAYTNDTYHLSYMTDTNISAGTNTNTTQYSFPTNGGGTVYTTGNKPTPADIGAATSSHTHSGYLSSSGGTVSGAITKNGSGAGFIVSHGTSRTIMYASTTAGDHLFGGNNSSTSEVSDYLRVGVNKLQYTTAGNTHTIYHTGKKPTVSEIGAAAANHSHSASEVGMPTTAISKTLTVSTSWVDTGIAGSNLATGTYVVQVTLNNSSTGFYDEKFSGIMSWFSGGCNGGDADEIVLHSAGHARNGKVLYLRTLRQAGSNPLKLQISCSASLPSASYAFNFRRLI